MRKSVITTSTGMVFMMEMPSCPFEVSKTWKPSPRNISAIINRTKTTSSATRTFTGFGGTLASGVTLITRVDLKRTATPLLGPLFRLLSAWVKLDVCASEPNQRERLAAIICFRTSLAVLSRRWLNAKVHQPRCIPERRARAHYRRAGAAEPLGYSMTSSARASSVGGTSSPRAFAVFRFITSS
jgi:hypothetical protein